MTDATPAGGDGRPAAPGTLAVPPILRPENVNPNAHTVAHGNALRLLLEMEDASVDALIADPPYSSGGLMRSDRAGDTKGKYTGSYGVQPDLPDFSGDNRDARAYGYWMTLWLTEALRVVKPGGVCVLFTDWRQLPTTTDALQAGGWVWRGVVPWHKPTSRPSKGRFTSSCEYAVWGTNGPRSTEANDGRCLPGFYSVSAPREREHITQKPLEVLRSLVQIVPPGALVLDPFSGSGTTAEACVLEGRRFVGFEIDRHYVDVARRRIENAVAAPDLFADLRTGGAPTAQTTAPDAASPPAR